MKNLKFNRKILLNISIMFVVGIITGGVTGVAITLNANEIKYTPSNEKFTTTNVKEAMDEIYKIAEYEIPADTYFYEQGTEGDSKTILRYKKINGEYYVCDEHGIIESGAEAIDISGKTLVEYTATISENLSAGSAGYASGSLYLGDGVDNSDHFEEGNNKYSVIQLTSNYSTKVMYTGTAKATFTLPPGKKYVGAGLASMTFSGNAYGGAKNNYKIEHNNGTLTATIEIGGNWGDTTISGKITLNVFVVDE